MSQVITRSEIPEHVQQALIKNFGAGQDRRQTGAFFSQSYRELMKWLDADQIIKLKGSRRATENNAPIPLGGPFSDYVGAKTSQTTVVSVDYNRENPGVGQFDEAGFTRWLDSYPDVYDIPISTIVFKFESQPLRDQLLGVLQDSIGFPDAHQNEFVSPFFAVMQAKSPGVEGIRDKVKEFHDPRYFAKPEPSQSPRGLGWPIQTMDLVALWSYRAYTGSKNVVMSDLTMKEIEDLAINHVSAHSPTYGAINAPLVINKWKQSFSRGSTREKHYDFRDDIEEWVQIK